MLGAITGFWLLKAVLYFYGPLSLALYSEYRRYSAFVVIFLLLGYPVTLSIYGVKDRTLSVQLIIPISLILFALFICSLILPNLINFLLLSSALALTSISYAIDRSKTNLVKGSYWLLFLGGLLPLALVTMLNDLKSFIAYFFFTVSLFLLYKMREINFGKFKFDSSFFRKSISRVPRELFQSALPFFMVFSANTQAGYVALILTLIMGGYIFLAPLNLISLEQAAKGKANFKSKNLLLVTTVFTVVIFSVYMISIPNINEFYFNNDEFNTLLIDSLVFVPTYFFYMTYRVVLDIYKDSRVDIIISSVSILIYFIFNTLKFGIFTSGAFAYFGMLLFIFYLINLKDE